MNVIKSDRIVWVDCDDTLLLWNLSEFPIYDRIKVSHVNGEIELVPHKKSINAFIKFWKLGYTMIVHSGSGHQWAESVVKALNLEPYTHTCMSKPMYYFDDMPVETWAGPRIYRDPHTGNSLGVKAGPPNPKVLGLA